MKNLPKFLGIIALAAVIGFAAASCSDGGGGGGGGGGGNPGGGGDPGNPGGPGVQKPVVPLKETYVSYDTDGNEYKLVITEVVGRTLGRDLDPTKNYTYTLTITFIDGTKATSTGTVAAKDIKPNPQTKSIEITLTHSSGQTIAIAVSGSDDSDTGAFTFDSDNENSTIPVDRNSAVKDVPIVDLPYSRTKDGKGWIITSGKSFVKNGVADLPATFRDLPVVGIGGGAFYGNTDLKSVTIPASVTSIGDGAFYECTNLATVTFAQGSQLKTIGGSAFENCTNLTSIIIPASVTSIGSTDDWAATFQNCTSLATVTFAEGSRLETIGRVVFQYCTSLTGITIPASVTEIGFGAFNFYFDDDYDDEDEGSVISNSFTTVTFAANSQLKTIGTSAFHGTGITSITIPDSVTYIGHSAFRRTNLSSVTIPAAVTAIGAFDDGWGVFADCTNLTTVTFAANSQLKTIGMGAFARSTSLTSITIPSSVTEIGIWAFCFMNLGSITIPESVTSIGSQAFAGWGPTQTINVQGNTAGWNNDWALYCDATINYVP